MYRFALVATALLLLAGCASAGRPGQTSYLNYVADRTVFKSGEIVLSAPLKESSRPYENLHVGLCLLVSPVKEATPGSDLFDRHMLQIADLARRLEPRVQAKIIEQCTPRDKISMNDLPALRQAIATLTDQTFQEYYRRWTGAKDYQVQWVVCAFYLGDYPPASPAAPRWLW